MLSRWLRTARRSAISTCAYPGRSSTIVARIDDVYGAILPMIRENRVRPPGTRESTRQASRSMLRGGVAMPETIAPNYVGAGVGRRLEKLAQIAASALAAPDRIRR